MGTGFANKNHNELLPSSIEAEQAVLGAILVDGEALHKVAEHIDGSNFFYKRAHQLIYSAFLKLNEKSENIDILTASQYLKDQNQLEEIGGRSYLSALTDHAPIAANAPYYAKIIKSKSLLRNMILAGNEIVELGHQSEEDLDKLVDKAEQLIFGLSQSKSKDQLIHIGELVHNSWKILEEREANKNQLSGLNTGFHDFNTLTSGLQKSDLLILAARPAMGKCLHKDSEIVLADGSLKNIEEIYKAKDAKLLSLGNDYKFKLTKPSDFIDDGIKPVFKVTTRTGRSITTTITHPYLSIEGWKKLGELGTGDKIAVPRRINVFGKNKIRDCEAKLLGYLIGDGSLTESSASFTNINPRIQEDFFHAIAEFDPKLKTVKSNNLTRADSFRVSKNLEFIVEQRAIFADNFKRVVNDQGLSFRAIAEELKLSPSLITLWGQGLVAPNQDCFTKLCQLLNTKETELAPEGIASISKNQQSSLVQWLEEIGLQGKNSHEKTIPDMIFTAEKSQVALFINRLFATDGWASLLSSGQSQLGYASVSKRLIEQVQHLLLRFGVISSIRHKLVKYKNGANYSWQLNITDQDSIKTFIKEIGLFGKEGSTSKIEQALKNKKSHNNKDLIPVEIWKLIERAKGTESWVSLATRAGFQNTSNIHAHKRSLSRSRLAAIAKTLENQELTDLAASDIYWDEIVSIEALGSDQVYDLTIPETHNFVANDICVHNTSLALNIAENVAVNTKKPVALFSLEMSKEQLVQRLLCSRAEVDSSRVRSGQLHAEDWAKLGTAMSELGEAPIYIDDSGGVSVMELRGKCRRLQAMNNGELGLVVIDYLQLLEGRSNDSRINQISEISRSLKMMARELNVPVMALSQLSRAVEARQDKRPMLSDLRDSGCLTADTLIYDPETGNYNPILDLVGKENFYVYALDQNKKLIKTKARKAFHSGKKKIYKVTSTSGHVVKASANHPFLTAEGWKSLEDLAENEFIATARRLKSDADEFTYQEGTEHINDEELVLLAHMIGDGCYLPRQPYHYTSKDQDCLNIVSSMSHNLYNIQCRLVDDRNSEGTQAVYMPSPYHLTHGVKHPFTNLLNRCKLKQNRSYQKELPELLLNCPLSQLSLFIRHLWATDGSISYSRDKNKAKAKFNISYSSQSRALIQRLKTLILRFGISSRISIGHKQGYRPSYQLNITDIPNIKLFAKHIGFFGQKQKDYLKLLPLLEEIESIPNSDVIPKTFWAQARESLAQSQFTHREFQKKIGVAYKGSAFFSTNCSRKRMNRVAEVLEDQDLKNLANSDIYWDKIKSIELIGEEDVYDIEVPVYHNFVAENYILHNSIEQDADIVVFIYRDDYYNPESEKAGIADVIIAKHRSGPVGVVELLFQNNITKFKNPLPGGIG